MVGLNMPSMTLLTADMHCVCHYFAAMQISDSLSINFNENFFLQDNQYLEK